MASEGTNGAATDAAATQQNGHAEAEQQEQPQIDQDLLPFDLSLHFPERPLLPSNAATLGLPLTPSPLTLAVQPTETLNDIRMTLADSPEGYWLGSYCFRRAPPKGSQAKANGASSPAPKGERVGEWTELKEVFEGVPAEQRELYISYAPFNEADARGQIQRLRDLLSGSHHDSSAAAIDSALTVQDAVRYPDLWTKEAVGFAAAQAAAVNKAKGSKLPAPDLAAEAGKAPFQEWSGWPSQSITQLIPAQARPQRYFPTCLRTLSVAAWSPPPQHLKARGHLLYLQVGTLEGETIFITASNAGFYINKSTSSKFDPSPRPAGEDFLSNSLFDLLCGYSAQFMSNFAKIFNDPLSARDFFAVLPLTNCLPASPWLARTHNHAADPMRPQTAYLLTGTTSLDSLEGTRDWNEEIQSSRELPKASLPERHVRERALARLFSEFSRTAANAVPKVAAGEIQALNPMDKPEAQMFCVNNLFISRGVDGVDIYPYLGGDEAAHVAVSKDVQGIRILNSLDVDGLCLLGTVIVDWHGERWVAQSIIPGLFRKREEEDVAEIEEEGKPAEASEEAETAEKAVASEKKDKNDPLEDTQVVYGGVEGPEVIRTNAAFHQAFEQVAKALHLSKHSIPDAKGKEHDLWLSVDSKGLRGADGRKYALDVARLIPVDVEFIEKDLNGQILEGGDKQEAYPHEMILLRPELLEIYWDSEFRKWAREELSKRQKAREGAMEKKALENGGKGAEADKGDGEDKKAEERAQDSIDSSAFELSFNPDAFVKFKPSSDESGAPPPMLNDESDASIAAVRAASKYLRESAMPRLISDVAAGIASAADGQALARQMHIRGINMRYLGYIAHLASPSQHQKIGEQVLKRIGPGYEVLLRVFRDTALHEMVLRAAKRVLNSLLKTAQVGDVAFCVSHFLNCLLGGARDPAPSPEWTPSPFEDPSVVPAWTELTPEALAQQIQTEVRKRFRFELPESFLTAHVRKPQLLRELCIRAGIQLKLQDYVFEQVADSATNGHAASDADSAAPEATSTAAQKKKKKSTGAKKALKEAEKRAQATTFVADDVLNLVPIVKDSAPTSKVAEDAFETGRITMMSRGDRELGVELLLEGISFHETIYGMTHPETARCYALFAAIVHQFAAILNAETAAKIREEQEKQGQEDVQVELPAYTEHLSGATALRYQRQAVTISERALGLDHPETLAQWASLAILERSEGNLEAALRCQQRVLELQDIIYGQAHPENITALSNLGTTLQNARNFEVSLQVFETAHEMSLSLYGPDSLNTANIAFELCQAQSLVGDLRSALDTLKESVRIFEARLGKEHSHTQEAELFLSRLAAAAVRAAKLEQSQKAREARSGALLGNARASMNAQAQAQAQAQAAGASDAAKATTSPKKGKRTAVDPGLSVDELVKYISGGGAAAAKSKSKGKGTARKGL